jgi:hypothetical protein
MYREQALSAGVGQRYAIKGVPVLVVIQDDGRVISASGRADLMAAFTKPADFNDEQCVPTPLLAHYS